MKSKEKQALVRVLNRAREDAENYLLSPHAANDYGDEYVSVLRQNAADFHKVAELARELELPASDGGASCAKQWEDLAAELEQFARCSVLEMREAKRFQLQDSKGGKH